MSNLIISRRCNQSCSYCFAGEQPAGPDPVYMPLEVYERCLDYLDRSGISQVRLLGGEPTLHPQFAEFVRRAQARGKMIIVFTNGWMPSAALEALEALPSDQCSVVLNVSATGKAAENPAAQPHRMEVLRRLGPKAQPGCNIYRPDADLDFIIDLIVETGCKPAVRVGLAQPILDGENVFLPVRSYPLVGERLFQFAELAARNGIKIELDCGFVRCMFSDAAVARLEELGADLGWHCSPIIDIDTNGNTFHCFPLAGKYSERIDFSLEAQAAADPLRTAAELRGLFESRTTLYRQAGIYKECASCRYKHDRTCSGGCLANTIRRFSSEPIHLSIQ